MILKRTLLFFVMYSFSAHTILAMNQGDADGDSGKETKHLLEKCFYCSTESEEQVQTQSCAHIFHKSCYEKQYGCRFIQSSYCIKCTANSYKQALYESVFITDGPKIMDDILARYEEEKKK